MLYEFVDKYLMPNLTDSIIKCLNLKTDKLIIFDIGCFKGNFSRNIKQKLNGKDNKFYLFDPNKNLNIKDFDYHKLAFSNKKEIANYYLNDFFPSSGSSLKTAVKDDKLWNFTRKLFSLNFNKGFSSHKVQTDILDNFCKENKIDKIDILKIDAEESELDILYGGKNILHNTNIIQIEIMDSKINFNEKSSRIYSFLKNNYDFEKITEKKIWSLSLLSKIRAKEVLFAKKDLNMFKIKE